LTLKNNHAILCAAVKKKQHAGMVQLVECLLAKEKVTGSSPVARSKRSLSQGFFSFHEYANEIIVSLDIHFSI
jgi:hypothetical protein